MTESLSSYLIVKECQAIAVADTGQGGLYGLLTHDDFTWILPYKKKPDNAKNPLLQIFCIHGDVDSAGINTHIIKFKARADNLGNKKDAPDSEKLSIIISRVKTVFDGRLNKDFTGLTTIDILDFSVRDTAEDMLDPEFPKEHYSVVTFIAKSMKRSS